jgi:choline-glycine betaine transporter
MYTDRNEYHTFTMSDHAAPVRTVRKTGQVGRLIDIIAVITALACISSVCAAII